MRDLIGITYDAGAGGPELTAAEWRQSDTALFHRDTNDLVISGVRGGSVSNVGFSATIAPLTAVVQTTAALGVYIGAFPAGATELTKTISAAHATLPRVDAIDVKIYDNEADSSGSRGIDIVYTAGTANSSPSAPTFTGVGVRLGTFAVPASGGGNPVWTANSSLLGYAGPGGFLLGTTRPSNPRQGTFFFNTSTLVAEYYNGTTWVALATSTSPDVQIFNSNGTWNKPAGARWVEVEGWGGGAGSGAAGGGAGQATGGGGGAGGYFKKRYAASDLNSSEPVTVGAGGTGTPTNGNAGGSTTFKGCTANGGTGGTSMASSTGTGLATNGVGGTASGGDENITGGDGGKGGTISGAALFSNHGGASPRGGGMAIFTNSVAAVGTAGKAPGGGASGSFAGGTGMNGASGAAGRVIVRTYF